MKEYLDNIKKEMEFLDIWWADHHGECSDSGEDLSVIMKDINKNIEKLCVLMEKKE